MLESVGTLLGISLLVGLTGIVAPDPSRPAGYLAFALVGVAASRVLYAGAASAPSRLRFEQTAGTLEALLLQSLPLPLLVVGLAAYDLCRGILASALLVAAGVAFANAPLVINVMPLLGGLAALIVISVSVGMMLSALVLVIKEAAVVTAAAVSALGLLSGAYFPASALPAGLSDAAGGLPTTAAFDLLRAGLTGAPVSLNSWLEALLAALLFPALGAALLHVAASRSAKTGTLGQY